MFLTLSGGDMMKRNIIFYFCPVLIYLSLYPDDQAYAQKDSTGVKKDPRGIVILTDVISFLPAGFIVIAVHELGHATMATLGGASNVKIGLFRRKLNGGIAIGWTNYRGNLSPFQTELFDAGGVLFSRGLAESTHLLVSKVAMPNWSQRFFSMIFIFSRFDFPRYVLQDALINLIDKKGSDMDLLVTQISGRETGWRTITYTLLLGMATVDLICDWDRISDHWNNLRGKPYPMHKYRSGHTIRIQPIYHQGEYGIGLFASW
jgi:hypothetical protein